MQLLFDVPEVGNYLLSPRIGMLIDYFRRNPMWPFSRKVGNPIAYSRIPVATSRELPQGTIEVRSSAGDIIGTYENICQPTT